MEDKNDEVFKVNLGKGCPRYLHIILATFLCLKCFQNKESESMIPWNMLIITLCQKVLSQTRFGTMFLSHIFYIFFYTHGKFHNKKKLNKNNEKHLYNYIYKKMCC